MTRLIKLLLLHTSLSTVWAAPILPSGRTTVDEVLDLSRNIEPSVPDAVAVESKPLESVSGSAWQSIALKQAPPPQSRKPVRLSSSTALERREPSKLENWKHKVREGWHKFKKKIGGIMEKVASVAATAMRFIPIPGAQIISAGLTLGLRGKQIADAKKHAQAMHHTEEVHTHASSGNNNTPHHH